jgi:diguanylate cyclase (GGDEF)-like protein
LLFIDLDRFKEVNDTLGHHMGDELLIQAAYRIQQCVRESDSVARLGGDEFTVILPSLTNVSDIGQIAQNIIDTLARPFPLGEDQAYISASVGITVYPDDAENIEDLLKNADQAMYAAKRAGRNRYSYFTSTMQDAANERMRLVRDIHHANTVGEFSVYYQPIVELATGRINKVEALLRWEHPQHGFISPAVFIPIAEDTGLIHDIGNWVFEESVHRLKRWRSRYDDKFQISINKSPVQFRAENQTYENWITRLKEEGLSGDGIAIEITEGLLLHADTNINGKLLAFRDAGIQVAIDDFGTGYSSLSYLMKFDIDYLKIDQSFVRNLGEDESDLALSEAIIVMAHKLGLKVIAEGVETVQQRDILKQIGCDYAQGYLYSRPVPHEQLEAWLDQQPQPRKKP